MSVISRLKRAEKATGRGDDVLVIRISWADEPPAEWCTVTENGTTYQARYDDLPEEWKANTRVIHFNWGDVGEDTSGL